MRVWTTFKDTHRSKGTVKMSREGHVRVVREGIGVQTEVTEQ